MKRSRQIYLLAIGLVAGILYAQFYSFTFGWAWLVLLVGSIGLLSLSKSKLGYVAFFVLAFVLGAWRMSAVTAPIHPHIDDFQYQKISLSGTVSAQPFWNERREFQYYLTDLNLDDRQVAGTLKIRSQIGNACEGCTMAVTGKIYPSLGKTSSVMSYAKPTVISQSIPVHIRLKNNFDRGLAQTLGKTETAFVNGILIGSRTQLPKQIQDDFNSVGLSHVVAVSGYNLTIIIALLAILTRQKWKWLGLITSLCLIISFVILTGAGASIMRAAIMSVIFLLGVYSGRNVRVEVCLALGLIITLLLDPRQLSSDLSWQLSFLSLTGIVFLTPKLARFLPGRGGIGLVMEILAVTLAAQIATLPLLALVFGRISLVAPLANIIVMPLIPLLMLGGFVCGLIGWFLPSLANYIGAPVNFLIGQLLEFISWLANLSWSSRLVDISVFQVVAIYALIACLALLRRPIGFKYHLSSGIIGTENVEKNVRTQQMAQHQT